MEIVRKDGEGMKGWRRSERMEKVWKNGDGVMDREGLKGWRRYERMVMV